MTQKELAIKVGVSESQIGQYENGFRNPKSEALQKIANALEVPYFDLLDDNDYTRELLNNLPKAENEIITNTSSYHDIENKLTSIGYSIGSIESEGYLWINYPDGTLEITEDELKSLDEETDEFLRFKLEQLKQQHIKDFKNK